jgi:hypothetical protein
MIFPALRHNLASMKVLRITAEKKNAGEIIAELTGG